MKETKAMVKENEKCQFCVSKDVQRILSSLKFSEKCNEQLGVLQQKANLKNFATFTAKNLSWSLFFNTSAGLQVCNFIKKRLQHRYFLTILRNLLEQLF